MAKLSTRWSGVLITCSLMAFTGRADDRSGRVPVHGIQWRFGAGGAEHRAPARERFLSPLFSGSKPWGTNEYLLIGAGVVVTIVVIVLLADDHHNDNPPHP